MSVPQSNLQQGLQSGVILPAQISPLGRDGQSLNMRTVSCSGGELTNIDDYLRPPNKAKRIRNFHQFTRGVFSSSGGGWQRDNATGLNSGASFLDFGQYFDALGGAYLLAQVGDTCYTYDTSGHAGTALTGMTALSTTLLPCIRPASPTGITSNPLTIYCNGAIEPLKIYGNPGSAPTSVGTLAFNNGFVTTNAIIGGKLVVGQTADINIVCPYLAINPIAISYTVKSGDTTAKVATGLAALINNKPALIARNIKAATNNSVLSITYPITLPVQFSSTIKIETATVGGTASSGRTLAITATLPNSTETAVVGGTIASGNVLSITATGAGITNGSETVTYTANGSDTTATVATALAQLINADRALSTAGVFATVTSSTVTINYPTALSPSFSQSATGLATITLNAGITGTTATASYTTVAGDTLATTAAALAASINATLDYVYGGFTATSSGAKVSVTYPSVLSPTWGETVAGSFTITLANATPSNQTSITFQTYPTSTWPGAFNALVYTKPSLCAPFMNRVAYANFANTGASGNGVTQQVLISGFGDAESFPQSTPTLATDAWAVAIPPALGPITALRSFRPLTNVASEILVIGCQRGMAVITGTDATSFSLQIQSTEFGVPSNRTFVQLDNTLLFMATDGFRLYNGSNNIVNLLTDSASLDIYDQFKLIDQSNWAVSHAVHHRDTQEVWFWVPYNGADGNPAHGDNGKPQHAFIFNYNTIDGNPIWYTIDNTVCMASIEFQGTMYGGDDVGLVQKWYGCNNYDDAVSGASGAQNIVPGAEIILPLFGVSDPAQFCSIQHTVVGTSSNDQKFLINSATYEIMDDGSTRKQQQQPINYLLKSISAGQTVLGTASPQEWALNSSAFPSSFPKFLQEYVPLGHGRLWEVSLSCVDTSHNLDFTFFQATISQGGQRI